MLVDFFVFSLICLGFYWVLTSFTGFYRVLLGFTEFYWVLPSFSGFSRILLGFTEFYWVLPSFTGFYRVLPSVTGFFHPLYGVGERVPYPALFASFSRPGALRWGTGKKNLTHRTHIDTHRDTPWAECVAVSVGPLNRRKRHPQDVVSPLRIGLE